MRGRKRHRKKLIRSGRGTPQMAYREVKRAIRYRLKMWASQQFAPLVPNTPTKDGKRIDIVMHLPGVEMEFLWPDQ